MPSYVSRFSLAVFSLAALTSSAHAGSISAIYSFGDSLSDAGNANIATGGAVAGPPYVNGEFSNGPIWVQDLAKSLGLPPVTASLLGGTDYAVGGAESGNTPVHTAGLTDLPAQLTAFHAANPVANPTGLYTIWIGSNDLADILASSPSNAQAAIDVAAVVANIDKAINTLAGEGAKDFLVVTAPDLGKTPEAIAANAVAAASALSLGFDELLVNGGGLIPSLGTVASADSLNLKVLDTYSLIDKIVAQPAAFGFTDVTDPCLTGEAVPYTSGGTVCSNPNQYLFWDQLHPTAAGQAIIAADAFQVLAPEPAALTMLGIGSLSLLAARRRSKTA